MSTKLNTINIKGLRHTHFEQLNWYTDMCKEEGYYYGNKKQFDKKHKEIKEWLNNILNNMEKED